MGQNYLIVSEKSNVIKDRPETHSSVHSVLAGICHLRHVPQSSKWKTEAPMQLLCGSLYRNSIIFKGGNKSLKKRNLREGISAVSLIMDAL